MLKHGLQTPGTSNVSVILRHRPTRQLALWLLTLFLIGSLWYYLRDWPEGVARVPAQTGVIVHKTEGEIDVLAWPEERWNEGPRNESQLEKAALVMLVR